MILADQSAGLIFANLVDFDMLYGHRKDVEGFAKSLEEFDELLAPLLLAMMPVRPVDDHRRPWLRSRSRVADDGSFARICTYHGRTVPDESAAST